MARWFSLVFLVLLFGTASVFAQSTQVGFAIVTPESGDSSGLSPVETLSNRTAAGSVQTGLTPSPVVTAAAVPVSLGSLTDGVTGLAIVNPTATAATVRLTVTDPLGTEILNETVSILPLGHFSKFVTEIFAAQLTPFTSRSGLLTVTSDVGVAVSSVEFQEAGFSSTPLKSLSAELTLPAFTTAITTESATTQAAATESTTATPASTTTATNTSATPATILSPLPNTIPGTTPTVTSPTSGVTITVFPASQDANRFAPVPTNIPAATTTTPTLAVGGTGAFIFPQIAIGGGWSTEITISNTSAAPQSVRIQFFDANGVLVRSVSGISIPSRGLYNLGP